VSLGLSWRWEGGHAEALPALWELLHEAGHGLHLLLSSQGGGGGSGSGDGSSIGSDGDSVSSGGGVGTSSGGGWKHFGGLHLPLDVLEVGPARPHSSD
jgi:hypothetical protein